MSHVRTQIRQALADKLVADCPQFDVFASFKYSRNIADKPMLDMRFLNENVDSESMGDRRVRVASLYLRLQRPAFEDEIDDLLDADEVAINASAMSDDWWVDLLAEAPELKQVNWSDTDEGGRVIGTIVLRYDVEYRVTQFDPETAE